MITIRRSDERGHFDHGWLDTRHTFSFGDYRDPQHTRFRVLRVINEDRVAPGQGFGMHPHRDMEIITWVVSGALEHRDSMGNGEVLRPGEVQRMSAGSGVEHSEFNPSKSEPVHLLQIWILPRERGIEPSYEQKPFDEQGRCGRLQLLVSPDGRDGSLRMNQDASIYAVRLGVGERVSHRLEHGGHAWVQIIAGRAAVNDHVLETGDGAGLSDVKELAIEGGEEVEALVFDLP